MEGAKHNNDLLARNQRASQEVRELYDKIAYFRRLYRQNVYTGVDSLLMDMTDVWVAVVLKTCLKIIEILEVGDKVSGTGH